MTHHIGLPCGCPPHSTWALTCYITPPCICMDALLTYVGSHSNLQTLLLPPLQMLFHLPKAIRLNFSVRKEEEVPSVSWLGLNLVLRSKGSIEPSDCWHVEAWSTNVCSQDFLQEKLFDVGEIRWEKQDLPERGTLAINMLSMEGNRHIYSMLYERSRDSRM